MNRYPAEKRIEWYQLLMVISLVLLVVTGSLIHQNSILKEKNRELAIRMGSSISVNMESGKKPSPAGKINETGVLNANN